MSTTARLGLLQPNGTVESIYLHFDGYPDRVLPLLNKNYNSVEKVQRLLDHGDMSVLSETLHKCIFYRRDRNEPYSNTCFMIDKSLDKYRNYDRVNYIYLYTPGLSWMVLNDDEG